MRLLFTRFPLESRFGGAEVQTLSLMKGLMQKGHDVSFLGSCKTLLMKSRELGIANRELPIGPPPVTKMGSISFFWRKKNMQKKLIEAIGTRGNPTAIFMLSLTEKLLLTEWCHDRGIKVIWVEHDRVGRWLTKNPWLPMLKNMSVIATTVVVSSLSRDIYDSLGWKGKVMTIPNGIDVEKFAPASEKSAHYPLRIGCIARLTEDKGVDVLIEALRDSDHGLTILGTGREEDALKKLAGNCAPNRITFLSSIEDLNALYRSIDVLVLPSREHDPFGLVIAEAMAAGVPTICTEMCGIAQYLEHGVDALIVKAGNVKELRGAIKQLEQPALWKKFADRGPILAQSLFSSSAMVKRYEALLY